MKIFNDRFRAGPHGLRFVVYYGMSNLQDEYYNQHYNKILNSGLLGFLKNLTHVCIEAGLSKNKISKVLELGAGTGYHKRFVRHKYDEYIESDLRRNLDQGIVEVDAENLAKFENSEFDRIIATCLLAHLANPQKALLEWRRCTRNGGLISIYVPCEPGGALRIFRLLTTNLKGRRRGINHYQFHYLEHRNYYINLKYILNLVFSSDEIRVRRFPFPYASWNFNFFSVYQIRIVKNE